MPNVEKPTPLWLRQDRQIAYPRIGPRDDRMEKSFVMSGKTFDRGAEKQVGIILEENQKSVRRLDNIDRKIEHRGFRLDFNRLNDEAFRFDPWGGRVVQREGDLEQRVVPEFPSQVEFHY